MDMNSRTSRRANLDHSEASIELILQGNVVTPFDQPIEFDPVAMNITGNEKADALLGPKHQEGWEL
jgi:hypothetical protein